MIDYLILFKDLYTTQTYLRNSYKTFLLRYFLIQKIDTMVVNNLHLS